MSASAHKAKKMISFLQFLLVASSLFLSIVSAFQTVLPSNHGNITSPNYPLNYGDGVNNRYLIVAPSGYVISFKFHLLELEDKDKNGGDTDVLKIIDGKKSQDRVRMFFSGNLSTPFYIISKTNQVRVIFISNKNDVTFKGFHITYQAFKKETSCSIKGEIKTCQIPNVSSSQCIEGCVNNLTLIPYNYSKSCIGGIFAPFACVDTKEIERCEADADYTNCKYTVDEMIRFFETLEIEEEVDATEEEEYDNDDNDYSELGRSISSNCRKFCRRKSGVWQAPERCSDLNQRKEKKLRVCLNCRRSGCNNRHI